MGQWGPVGTQFAMLCILWRCLVFVCVYCIFDFTFLKSYLFAIIERLTVIACMYHVSVHVKASQQCMEQPHFRDGERKGTGGFRPPFWGKSISFLLSPSRPPSLLPSLHISLFLYFSLRGSWSVFALQQQSFLDHLRSGAIGNVRGTGQEAWGTEFSSGAQRQSPCGG